MTVFRIKIDFKSKKNNCSVTLRSTKCTSSKFQNVSKKLKLFHSFICGRMLKKNLPSYDKGKKINEKYKNILKMFLINVIYKTKSDDTNNVNDVNNENIVNSVNCHYNVNDISNKNNKNNITNIVTYRAYSTKLNEFFLC